MKIKIVFISLFASFALIAMGSVWLFAMPVVSYGYGKNYTLKHASDRVWARWREMFWTHQKLVSDIKDQRQDILSAQERSYALREVLQESKEKHEDVTVVNETNSAFINRTISDLGTHAKVAQFADVLSTQVSVAKKKVEGVKLQNLIIVPEGVNPRFHAVEEDLHAISVQQQELIGMDSNMLNLLQANLSSFGNQIDQVVNKSAYFKGLKDSFLVKKIQKTMEENLELQAKIALKQKKIAIIKQKHNEQVQALEKSMAEYREFYQARMLEQKERIHDNNELLKDRMREQKERMTDFRERANESRSRMLDAQQAFKDKTRK